MVAVATLICASFLPQLEHDTGIKSFVRPVARELVESVEDEFGEGSYLTLVFESGSGRSLMEPVLLHQQLRVIQAIEEAFPVTTDSLVGGIDQGLLRVRRKSLLEHHDYSDIAEAIVALSGGRTVEDVERVSAHFVSHPEAINFYARLRVLAGVTPFRPPGVPDTEYRIPYVQAIKSLIRLDPEYPREQRKTLLAAIRDLVDSLATPELAIHVVNDDLLTHDIDIHGQRNAVLLASMVLLVDALCLAALFRNGREIFVIFAILATACIWTFGLAAMLGMRLSFLHLLGLPILLGTGIDDTLIFGRRLGEERARGRPFPEALRVTFASVGNAIFLTTFTTFLAFFAAALTAAAEVVESFYLLVSVSMVVVMILATLLQGALRAELDRHARGREWLPTASPSPLDTATRRMTRLSSRLMAKGPRPTLLVAGFFLVLAVSSATRLESDLARDDFLQSGMPTKAAHEAAERYFGTSRVGYVVLTGDVQNAELLLSMKSLRKRLTGQPLIEQVVGTANMESVVDLIRKLGIPITPETDVREVLDQILANERTANYVLDMSYAETAERLVRKNGERYDGLLMRFFVRGDAGSTVRAACQAVWDEITALGIDRIPGVGVEIGGGDVTLGLEAVHYRDAMVRSFLMSLVGNFLVLAIAWRRVLPALLAMTPLVLATIFVLGVMPVFGVTLNPINLSIGAIVIGLGIDYPIHIIERFDEEVGVSGLVPSEAARKALDTTGPHVLAGMLTTSVGFCAACVLLLPLSQSFGLLTGAAVAFVYFTSMLALPGLLVWFHTREPLRRSSGRSAAAGQGRGELEASGRSGS